MRRLFVTIRDVKNGGITSQVLEFRSIGDAQNADQKIRREYPQEQYDVISVII